MFWCSNMFSQELIFILKKFTGQAQLQCECGMAIHKLQDHKLRPKAKQISFFNKEWYVKALTPTVLFHTVKRFTWFNPDNGKRNATHYHNRGCLCHPCHCHWKHANSCQGQVTTHSNVYFVKPGGVHPTVTSKNSVNVTVAELIDSASDLFIFHHPHSHILHQ